MNFDKIESGQHDGDEENGEDHRLVPSYWQNRAENWQGEAAKVAKLLEEEAVKVMLLEAGSEEKEATVKLLEAELLESSKKLESQRELLEELLRTGETTSSFVANPGSPNNTKEGTQREHPNFGHHNKSLPTPTSPQPSDVNTLLSVPLYAISEADDHYRPRVAEEIKVEEERRDDFPHTVRGTVERTTLERGQQVLTHPGAVAVFQLNAARRQPSMFDDEESTMIWPAGNSNASNDPLLVASLVEEESPPLPSTVGTVIDTKRRRLMNVVRALSLAGLVALVTSIAVVYTRSNGKSVTPSPTSSLEPSISPSSYPSSSPSTGLFGFLAEHASFDHGAQLLTNGSPQKKAMDFVANMSAFPTLDHKLLQTYVLATLYYATWGNKWTSSPTQDYSKSNTAPVSWLSNAFSCSWPGVLCNNVGEIISLQLSSCRLVGSIPAELAVLHQSLSKIMKMALCLLVYSNMNQLTCFVLACAGTLDLSDNLLIEGVPSSFGHMTSLGK